MSVADGVVSPRAGWNQDAPWCTPPRRPKSLVGRARPRIRPSEPGRTRYVTRTRAFLFPDFADCRYVTGDKFLYSR